MTPERWQQIKRLYHSALEREESQREIYLKQACAGDDALRQEVESLLAHDDPTEGFLPRLTALLAAPPGNGGDALIGRQMGLYYIVSVLGAGGMGEVYQARDTKLGRHVAIKVLPTAFAHDPERLARFKREARTLASLNHPNIATIYSLEEADGVHFLIMELVPGETLAERVRRGALVLQEALKVATQIAAALEAAHEKGVIHRDLKPANVKVTPEGRVKVLDFGLAKTLAGDGEADLTLAPTLTQQGIILGTPAYMSPEQARGKPVDKRTDIWAFGCVFYECLTGTQAFRGETACDTIAAVLEREPDWKALPPATPTIVRELLRRCLQKDANRRFSDMAKVRIETDAPSRGSSESDAAIGSLAVLPFANASSDSQLEYLSDGITESIILNLSQLSQLRVIARTSVFQYKGRGDDAQEIGRILGVGAVATGRVLQRGKTLIINAELVDVEKGWQLWGGQYGRTVADIFAIEEEIAKEISENLRLKLTPERQSLLAKRYTDNVEAYHLFLKGRFYWAKRTEEGLYKGIQYFRQAIELDPLYALAYAGVAEGYVPLAVYCHLAPKDACPKARAAAHAALEIDPELSEARTVLGAIMSYYDWDLENAEKELRQAAAIDPKYPRARQALAENLTISGRFEEAVIEAKRALELDPLALSLNAFMAMTYYFGRDYDRAIEHGLRTVEMDPNFFPGYFYLGMAYQITGQFAEAATTLQKARVLSNNSTLMVASLGGALAAWGKQEEARNILHELEQMSRRKYVSQVFVAAILTGLGEKDRALTCLETAYEDRCTWLPRCLAADARFDRLHSESRLQGLSRRMGISHRPREQK